MLVHLGQLLGCLHQGFLFPPSSFSPKAPADLLTEIQDWRAAHTILQTKTGSQLYQQHVRGSGGS